MVKGVHKIVYSSSAVSLFTQDELNDLITMAGEKNKRFSVTGCLVYHDGNIIQYLEGPASSVNYIFECIRADHRHKGIIELCNAPVDQRAFGEWQMGLKYIPSNQLRNYKTVEDLFKDMLGHSCTEKLCLQARIFFETFLHTTGMNNQSIQ